MALEASARFSLSEMNAPSNETNVFSCSRNHATRVFRSAGSVVRSRPIVGERSRSHTGMQTPPAQGDRARKEGNAMDDKVSSGGLSAQELDAAAAGCGPNYIEPTLRLVDGWDTCDRWVPDSQYGIHHGCRDFAHCANGEPDMGRLVHCMAK